LERAARLLLLVGDHGLRGGPRLDAVHHQGERLRGLRRVDRGRLTVVGQHLAARRVEQLEVVHGQALVLEALVDDPVLGLRLLVDLVPVAGRLRHLVGAVVEERRVRVERQRPVLALVVRRLERARDELVLARVHRAGHVLEPALRGELGGPHHVHAEHVALRRLGALSLGELVELLGGVLGQLDELGLHVRVRLVVHLHDLLERAAGVLADAPGHRALGVLSGVRGHGSGARSATAASSAGADADRRGAGEYGNSYGSPHVLSSHGLSNGSGYPGSWLLNRLAFRAVPDAVVIGGGHNGLVAAAYLARAGLSVELYERRELVGGACVTEELWPGVHASPGADTLSLLRPEIMQDLQLGLHGLTAMVHELSLFAPFPDGRHVATWLDRRRTWAQLDRDWSREDADGYLEWAERWDEAAQRARPLMLEPPSRARWLEAAGPGILDGPIAEELAGMPSEQVRVPLAMQGLTGTLAGPDDPGTAFVAFYQELGLATGVPGA